MRARLIFAALMPLALSVSTSAIAKDDYVYGLAPDWARYKALAEPAVRARIPEAKLGDPANWSIDWPNGYMQGGWRHKGRFRGYFTCGTLQPIAPVDGRYRRVTFVVVIDRDQVQTVDISSHESNSMVNVLCQFFVSHGDLPPASLMGATLDVPIPHLGATIRPMPEGAYVVAVQPGSRAERSGLTTGMVLTSVNGIPLATMGPAMAKLLDASTATLSIETTAGRHIDVAKVP